MSLQTMISNAVKDPRIMARIAYFGHKCWMCRGPYDLLDHVISRGPNFPSNLRPACRRCNSLKGNRWTHTIPAKALESIASRLPISPVDFSPLPELSPETSDAMAALTRKCVRCGHQWRIREAVEPAKCPNRKCPSPFYWNKPRRTPKKEKAS